MSATEREVRQLLEHYPRIFFACHQRHVRDVEAQATLSSHQVSILDHLDEVDAISLTELASHMGVTPATMSIHIERLVRKGYVRREQDTADGRRRLLRLTPAGVRLRSAQSVLEPERVQALLARLGVRERREGLRGLALLARAAQDLMTAAPVERRGRHDARGAPP
jgi:DNA-binding MarR family transcriptional regulator